MQIADQHIMERVEEANPDLYAEFHEAKFINDRGTRHKTEDNPTPAPTQTTK